MIPPSKLVSAGKAIGESAEKGGIWRAAGVSGCGGQVDAVDLAKRQALPTLPEFR